MRTRTDDAMTAIGDYDAVVVGSAIYPGHSLKSGQEFADRSAEALAVVALRAPEGDYHDWDEIHRWASDIADVLHAEK